MVIRRCIMGTIAIACLLAAGGARAASEVHVDIQPTTGTTAVGYVAITPSNRWDNGTSADLGGGVRGAWLDYVSAHTGDRGASYSDLLNRDFIQWSGSDTPETLKMTGVQPGTYDLKIYAWDPQYNDKRTQFSIDQNNDAVIDQTITIENPNPPGEKTKTVSVTVSAAGVLSIMVSKVGSATGAICGLDLTPGGVDLTPPAGITTLATTGQTTTQVMLRWTAPADDNGTGGKVASYDVRYSTTAIDAGNWASAVQASGEPTPANPGLQESFTVSGFLPSTTYYFAVKSSDGSGNTSALSNVISAATQAPDLTAPTPVSNLAAGAIDTNQLMLTWTASGDDGDTGTATSYNLRYSTSAIVDEATFASATAVTGLAAPKATGGAESFTVTGLTAGTKYYFALKVADEAPNWSGLSNVVETTTLPPDVTPPSAIGDLAAINVDSNMLTLNWTSPGDDGNTGSAVAYDMRYSTSTITEANWNAATQASGEPTPGVAGTVEHLVVGGLQAGTTYYFAIKADDNGVPPNVSTLSNVLSVTTLPPREAVYAVSNEFSLDPSPAGPYDAAVPVPSGDITITNINVAQAGIVRTSPAPGAVFGTVTYTGTVTYSVTASTADIHVWLELSTDGGATWAERRIHAVGSVGTIQPGPSKTASWLVDGDHGNHCKIRIRVNDRPFTYSNLDADNNKMPRPVPWAHYPLLERMTDKKDFVLTDSSRYTLPRINFNRSIAAGQAKVGFARTRFYHAPGQYVTNPIYFMHCCYIEAADGQKWVLLQGDTIQINTDQMHGYRDQINAAYGIPKDNIMSVYTHVHNGGSSVAGVGTFPMDVLAAAIANAEPAEVGWVNHDMGTSHNVHRNLYTDATHALSSYENYKYTGSGSPVTDVIWEFDALGNITGGLLDGSPFNSAVQANFDCPLDSYLQMLVVRNLSTHALKGVLVKFTGHPLTNGWTGDMPRCVMDIMQQRFASNVEIMYSCGYGNNHRMLAAKSYPSELGVQRTASAFADVLENALPTLEFAPLTKVGQVAGYDMFGRSAGDGAQYVGTDPDRLGMCVHVFALNDIYVSTVPGEAPSEMGFYIRARTSDTRHIYTGYGDSYTDYFPFGRTNGVSMYENRVPPKYGNGFRMAQEVVRGVNILEQALSEARLSGDIDGDGHVDVVDLLYFVDAFGSVTGDANYNPAADFNTDGSVDVIDLLMLVDNWGL
jgi:chitodextrinase